MVICHNFFAADKRYWAKDVVFLVSSEGELGVQAWLSEYTGEKIRGTVQFSYKYIDRIAYIYSTYAYYM